ncbi:MAG: hypothetical protein J0M08_03780 [Bacteroidetes bacterium]|nr:hypothetical protein [Bacteroidota bacterium]
MSREFKFVFIVFFILTFFSSFACECPPINTLDINEVDKYDVLFEGQVVYVDSCDTKSSVQFRIDKLFKGVSDSLVDIQFDCSSDCQMSFAVGEIWIMYVKYAKFGKLKVDLCSRTRKKLDATADYYTTTHQLTFVQEIEMLTQLLGKKDVMKINNPNMGNRNLIIPKRPSMLLMLIFSVVGMVAIYFIIKKIM